MSTRLASPTPTTPALAPETAPSQEMGTAPAPDAADGAPAVRSSLSSVSSSHVRTPLSVRFARPEGTTNSKRSPCVQASFTSFGYTGLSLTGGPCDPRSVPLLPILSILALGHQTPDSVTP